MVSPFPDIAFHLVERVTWQALERTGGVKEGKSPVYMFKRVKREKAAAK